MPFLKPTFLTILACLWGASTQAQTCAEDIVDLRGNWGQARFTVEVADDDAERSQGLMFRQQLGSSQGMLFVYEDVGHPAFWMKNTLIPLDMLFITPEGIVQHIHSEARPHDLTPISGGDGVLMVLEIAGGMAGLMGITPGSQLRYPTLDQTISVWPCDTAD